MSSLQQALEDYLALRRGLGYRLERAEKLLRQFVDHLDRQHQNVLTTEAALAWARMPQHCDVLWWSHRLGVVRGFATYLHALDDRHEVPPTDVLPWRSHRAHPYLYTSDEIVALMNATAALRFPLRAATYHTLIGLLVTTGMRIGEAINLDAGDFDPGAGVLTIRNTKGSAGRLLPLHPTTAAAILEYLHRPDRIAAVRCPALLISPAGTRLRYCNINWTWLKLLSRTGIRPRSSTCRPRIHDLRHSFAVSSLLDAYRHDLDIDRRLTLLATYLGHLSPAGTYWYLSAAPELLAAALERLDHSREAR